MNLVITVPLLSSPHGGLRVLCELASRLSNYHSVSLYVEKGSIDCNWFDFPSSIRVVKDMSYIRKADCVIIGSPHSIHLARYARKKVFIYLQMLEHMFNPTNTKFYKQCVATYRSHHPLISVSKWNIRELTTTYGRTGKTFYIPNGVSIDQFPITYPEIKERDTVLVEGWECNNLVKDTDHIAPKVAKRLKEELGCKIIGYSQKPLTTFSNVPDEYYQLPSVDLMNNLYERSTILLKASKYDCRATAPMEAMTKGTPTARALIEGDDDLIHEYNCLRVEYNENKLYDIAKRLLTDKELYYKIQKNCYQYLEENNWDIYIQEINTLICSNV